MNLIDLQLDVDKDRYSLYLQDIQTYSNTKKDYVYGFKIYLRLKPYHSRRLVNRRYQYIIYTTPSQISKSLGISHELYRYLLRKHNGTSMRHNFGMHFSSKQEGMACIEEIYKHCSLLVKDTPKYQLQKLTK